MKTVVGLYDDINTANQVVQELDSYGIDRNEINVVAGNREGSYTSETNGDNWNSGQTSAMGNATSGLLSTLTEAGVPDEEARYYVEGVNHGGNLVSVRVDDDEPENVVAIMNRYNPIDVKERAASWRSAGRPDYGESVSHAVSEQSVASNYDRSSTLSTARTGDTNATSNRASSAAQTNAGDEETRIPVVEEDVKIGKRAVEQGGVRVRKHIEEEPVEKQVNLREENVTVDRRPVNRPADAADFNTFEEGEFEVSSISEEAVVQKDARVVEEVVINKDAHERTETVRDTARKTRVDVEQTGGNGNNMRQASSGYDTAGFRSHYQTNYGTSGHTFEDYDPAYRYGYTVANDARYRGRNWNDIESDLRRDWNQNHKGSAWEDFKDAVRYSWERTKAAVTS